MHNLSDEEMDRLAREAAEHYKVPGAGQGWDKLSRRLDEELPQKRKDRRIILWIFLGIALFTGGTGIYFNQNNNQDLVQSSGQPEKLSKDQNLPDTRISESSGTIDTQKPDLPAPAKNLADGETSVSTTEKNGPNAGQSALNLISKNKEREYSSSRPSKRFNELKPANEANIRPESPDGKNANQNNPSMEISGNQPVAETANKNPGATTDKNITPAIAGGQPVPVAMVPSHPPIENKTAENAIKNKKLPSPAIARKWEFGFTVAPDKSNVSFTDKDQTGINIGLTVGYRLSERWSLQTGLLYTKKYYTTSGDNYKFPPNYWANNPNVTMERVKANCEMFDIPLNVRYNWLVGRNHFAFVSAGLSSYLMNQENFEYYYYYYSDPGYKQWTNNNAKNYFFSVGNLSAGYEQQITPALSIQAEPFFKFSLGGVGYGSVKLNSYGMFLGIKYKPGSRKK